MSSKRMLDFIDPTESFENSILRRAKKQIDLLPSLRIVLTTIKNIGNKFVGIQSEIDSLSAALKTTDIDSSLIDTLNTLSQLFSGWSRQVVSQSYMSLQAVNMLIPSIQNMCNEYVEVQNHYYKTIESYGSLDKRARNDELISAKDSLAKAATSRSGYLYSIDHQTKASEDAALRSVSVTISQFMALSASLMQQFLQTSQATIEKSKEIIPHQEKRIKKSLGNIGIMPSNNPATKAAYHYWDIRFVPGTQIMDKSFVEPNTNVWLRETHPLSRATWARKRITFSDSVLTLEKASGPFSLLTGVIEDSSNSIPKTWVLPLVTVTPTEQNRMNTFKIQGPEGIIELQALSKTDLDEWITIFTDHNMKMLGQNEKEVSKKCTDCGASDATWCSVNWACDLCLKCSGVHRALSTTNSKVRSATLDKLNPMVINMMNKLKGDCNKLLMADKCREKIDSRTDEATRTDFITRKYINFEWAMKGVVPNAFDAILHHDIHALFYSAHFGRIEEIEDSLTPFHAACSLGDPDAVALLTYCVSNMNARDRKGWTPLCYAVFFKHTEIVKFLLSAGADARNVGINIYQLAIATKDKEIIKAILPIANSTRNDETEFRPVTLKYAPPGTPQDYTLVCKPTQRSFF